MLIFTFIFSYGNKLRYYNSLLPVTSYIFFSTTKPDKLSHIKYIEGGCGWLLERLISTCVNTYYKSSLHGVVTRFAESTIGATPLVANWVGFRMKERRWATPNKKEQGKGERTSWWIMKKRNNSAIMPHRPTHRDRSWQAIEKDVNVKLPVLIPLYPPPKNDDNKRELLLLLYLHFSCTERGTSLRRRRHRRAVAKRITKWVVRQEFIIVLGAYTIDIMNRWHFHPLCIP